MGGRENVSMVSACAETRLRIVLREPAWLDQEELMNTGIKGIMPLEDGVIHLLTGLGAHQYEVEMRGILSDS